MDIIEKEKENEERFMNLEIKIAYLEDFVNQLQEVTVENQKTIENLRTENKILSGKIQDLQDSIDIPNRKPPHY